MSLSHLHLRVGDPLKEPFSHKHRGVRMGRFIEVMGLEGGERILDMGGVGEFWNSCPLPLNLTIVNLPGSDLHTEVDVRHTVTYLEGDACDMSFVEDDAFDIAFSNSVIEHVGGFENQRRFAREVLRVAPRYWVQTPAIWFPIEAHSHMPLWWFYPSAMRRAFISRWRTNLPAWTDMIEGTTVIRRRDLQEMFPRSTLWTERVWGITKSYVVYGDGSACVAVS